MKLSSKFPKFYTNLIPDVLDWDVPEERFADCQNCHLCASDKLSLSQSKCCTYHAILPNYMVGAILSETEEEWQEGKNRVSKKIKDKKGVTPYGITGSPDIVTFKKKYSELENYLVLPLEQHRDYFCPYLNEGNCTIWKFRSELCITYFCHPVSGKYGSKFWDALYNYVRFMERQLSLYALTELGFPFNKLYFKNLKHDSFNFNTKDGGIDLKLYDKLWSHISTNEVDFYKKTYEIVKSIDAMAVNQILGLEGKWRLEKAKELLVTSTNNILQDGLLYNPKNQIKEIEKDLFEVTSPTGEKEKIGKLQLLALKMFDGSRNVTDVLRDSKLMFKVSSKKVQTYVTKELLIKDD